jgi:hypothetical protein
MDGNSEEIIKAIKQAQAMANNKQQHMALLYINDKYTVLKLRECEETPLEVIRYVKREPKKLVVVNNRISYAD